MTVSEPDTLTARGPLDILSVTPYLVGHHPAESVVLHALRDGRVVVTARWDLPTDVPGAHALAMSLERVLRQADDPDTGLIVYSSDSDLGWACALRLLVLLPFPPLFALAVGEDGWWDCLTDLPGDPPREAPSDASAIAAHAVLHGMVALPSRRVIETALHPLPPRECSLDAPDRVVRLKAVRRKSVLARTTELDRLAGWGTGAPREARARAGLIVGTERPWTHAWRGITRQTAAARLELWMSVLRVTHRVDAAPVFALIGIAGWLTGDGSVTSVCLERGLAIDPRGGSGLGLLNQLIDDVVPPSEYATLIGLQPAKWAKG
jgi:hypothetical protein